MKSKLVKTERFDPKGGFIIRQPKWFVCLCFAISFVFLVISVWAFHRFFVGDQGPMVGTGLCFLALSALCAVVAYICDYNKLSYTDKIYKYYRPFGKKRSAAVEEIGSVKILTVYRITGARGSGKKIWIFFYDKNRKILIKMNDDGALFSKNEAFLKSLKYNHIKIRREEKFDY